MRILLTGAPGIGKTTLVRTVVTRLHGRPVSGFLTEELRGRHGRAGFKVATLDGREGRLASLGSSEKGPRVGRYTVHLGSFEAVALPAIAVRPEIELYVLDEIGKMECLSPAFVTAVRALFAASVPLLATVARKGGGLIEEVKALPEVELLEVTRENRDRLVDELERRLEVKS